MCEIFGRSIKMLRICLKNTSPTLQISSICNIFTKGTKENHLLNKPLQSMSTLSKISTSSSPKRYWLLIFPSITMCLGIWQVRRLKWKLGLIEQLNDQIKEPPIDIPSSDEACVDLHQYQPIKVRGVFDHSREVFVGPRPLIRTSLIGPQYKLKFGTNPIGYLVITPFKLANSNRTILVNRGWVHSNKLEVKSRQAGQVSSQVELVGLFRPSESCSNIMTGAVRPNSKGIYLVRDVNQIAELLNTSPIFLDAVFDTTVPEGPIGGQTIVELRNEHLQYAITWFSLTAIMTAMWFFRHSR